MQLYEKTDAERTSLEPFDDAEIRRAFLRPDLAIDLLLAQHDRWLLTLTTRARTRLMALTLGVALIAALPFGSYFGPTRVLHVAMLFFGSVSICFPSLHVFSSYLGIRLRIEQTLALSFLVAAVASIFSLGFSPIVYFLAATIEDTHARETVRPIAAALLAFSLFAGMGQLGRCVRNRGVLGLQGSFSLLMWCWQAMLVYITYRMAGVLGIAG